MKDHDHLEDKTMTTFKVCLFFDGDLGRLASLPEQSNVLKLYRQFDALPQDSNRAVIYQQDPFNHQDWSWFKQISAWARGLSMEWSLNEAYGKILYKIIDFYRHQKCPSFNVEFHVVGARAGGTLLRQLINQFNARLKDDLYRNHVVYFNNFYFANVILFDCAADALDEKPLRRRFYEDFLMQPPKSQPSHHLAGNISRIIHFVAANEPDPKKSISLIDRYYLRQSPTVIEEIWCGGDSADICSQSEELNFAIRRLNESFDNKLKQSSVSNLRQNQTVIKRNVECIYAGDRTLEDVILIAMATMNEAALINLPKSNFEHKAISLVPQSKAVEKLAAIVAAEETSAEEKPKVDIEVKATQHVGQQYPLHLVAQQHPTPVIFPPLPAIPSAQEKVTLK